MQFPAIKIRWLNDACYEIKLPNGKGILTDPYIDESRNKLLPVSAVEAANYILISHTHFDHVLALKELSARFDSQIFTGCFSGAELACVYDIPGYRMNLCSPGMMIDTEDFRLECFAGKHTNLGDSDLPSNWPSIIVKEGLPSDTMVLNILGNYEYLIYQLTLPSHFKVLIWGGGATYTAIKQAEQFSPNVTIAQLPRENTDTIAKLYATIGGQVIFPHHHEFFMNCGEEGQQVIRDVVKKTMQLSPDTTVLLPEKGKWYTFSTSIELE